MNPKIGSMRRALLVVDRGSCDQEGWLSFVTFPNSSDHISLQITSLDWLAEAFFAVQVYGHEWLAHVLSEDSNLG